MPIGIRFGFAFCGGPKGDRTLDLRVANAALSQLSYEPKYLLLVKTIIFKRRRITGEICGGNSYSNRWLTKITASELYH